MIRLLPIVILLVLNVTAYAQSGPGGLGTTDGSSDLELWLRADQGIVESQGVVSTWGDISGNGRNFVQINANERPDLVDNVINGRPTVSWKTAANTHMISVNTAEFFGTDLASPARPTNIGDIIIVNQQAVDNNGYVMQFRRSSGNNSFLTFMTNGGADGNPVENNDDDLAAFIRETSSGSWETISSEGTAFEDGYPSGAAGTYYATRFGFDPTDAGNNDEFWLYDIDGLIDQATGLDISYDDGDGQGALFIGADNDTRAYNGEIAEIMVFSERLTDAQYIIVQNYLNARYGLTIINEFYAGDESANGDADFGVFGIGQDALSNNVTSANKDGLSLTANAGLEDGDYVFGGYAELTLDNNAIIDNDILVNSGTIEARLKRAWFLDKTDVGITLTTDLVFDLDDAGVNDAALANATGYRLLRRDGTSGEWTNVAGASSINDGANTITFNGVDITDGYYTIGTSNNTTSPLGDIQQIWYSFQSGSWGDFNSWTQDGATTPTFVNDNSEVPGPGDQVIITAGRTIRMYEDDAETTIQNDVILQSLTLRGSSRLRLLTSTGHDFGNVSGAGTIALQGIPNTGTTAYLENLPAGNYEAFADQLLGGTIEISAAVPGAGVPIILNQDYSTTAVTGDADGAVSRTMTVNMGNAADVVILQRDLYLNRNLNITRGRLRIHRNNAETYADVTFVDTDLNITIINNTTVSVNGSIRTGDAANTRHQFDLFGNLTVNGTAYFTQRTTTIPGTEATDGVVDLNFLNQVDTQTLTCNGVSRFYRLEIDKGAPTVFLNITASSAANFNLFGAADYNINTNLEIGGTNDNAFALITGGVSIGTNVIIDPLNTVTNYALSDLSTLQIDGGRVTKSTGTALVPYGTFRLNSGEAEFLVQSGITMRNAGRTEINGGQLYMNALRVSIEASGDAGSYIQTGGDVVVNGGSGEGGTTTLGSTGTNLDYAVFSIWDNNNVFRMSGGNLTISRSNYNDSRGTADETDDLGGSIFINSDPANYQITGGTVIIDMDDGNPAKITSRAPFYNLVLTNSSGLAITDNNTAATAIDTIPQPDDVGIVFLAGGQAGDDVPSVGGDAQLAAQPLVILNDLTIGDGTNPIRFDHLGRDITVSRNFTLESGAELFFGDEDLLPADLPVDASTVPVTHQNTVTFDGSINSTLTFDNLPNVSSTQNEQLFHNLIVSKTGGAQVLVVATIKPSDGNNSNALRVAQDGSFRLESGTVDQGDRSIRFYGSVYNADTLGVYESGVTNDNALLKFRPNDFTIDTEPGSVFGNFRLNSESAIITLENDVVINRIEYRHGRLNIGSNNVTVNELDINLAAGNADFGSCAGCLSPEDMIITNGNASDGGLTLRITDATNDGSINGNATLDGLSDDDWLFPIGIGTSGLDDATSKYTPVLLSISDVGDVGTDGEAFITVNPVDATLSTTDQSFESLSYYWRIRTEGFDVDPTIDLLSIFGNDDDAGATFTSYVSGKVDDGGDYIRTGEPTNTENDPADPDFETTDFSFDFDGDGAGSFTLTDANFTAGLEDAFNGVVQIFYSNEDGSNADWQFGSSWNSPAEIAADPVNGGDVTDEHDDDINQIAGNVEGVDYPGLGDIAILGVDPDAGIPHSIRIEAGITARAAEFRFANNATITAAGRGGFSFIPELVINSDGGIPTIAIGQIIGEGLITDRNNTDPDLSAVDIGDYALRDGSFYMTENFQGSFTYDNVPSELPNLIVTSDAFGDNDHTTTYSNDIEVRGDLVIAGGSNLLLNADSGNPDDGDFDIGGDLILINGYELFPSGPVLGDAGGADPELRFPGSGVAVPSRSVSVGGDFLLSGTGSRIVIDNSGGGSAEHNLSVSGNITDASVDIDGGITLFENTDGVILTMDGDTSSVFSRSNVNVETIPDLYQLVIAKEAISDTVLINTTFTLPLPSVISAQPLEIVNGLTLLDDPDIDITLTDEARGDFRLPNTLNDLSSSGAGGLEVAQGVVRITGDDTGLLLDGPLILSGGDVDMSDCVNNGNNFIEYSSTGFASITISDAASTLSVGSQIRRNFFSDAGILDLTITDGNLEIGACTEGDPIRGMLEVVNDFSSFIHTGGTITFLEQNGTDISSNIASLLLEPATSDLSGSNIVIDLVDANDVNFSINSTIPLNNLSIESDQSGTNTNNEVVQLKTRPLTIDGDLLMNDNVELRSNNLDLTLNGDFTLNGLSIYTPGLNKTTFNVAAIETNNINGTSLSGTFYDFDKTGEGDLNLGKDITIEGATFDLTEGTLNDVGNLIDFRGQVMTNSAIHTSTLNTVNAGIRFNRSGSQQILKTANDGIFGNITIDNAHGVNTPDLSQEFRVTNQMTLADGILDIGPALLVFGQTAELTNDLDAGTDLTDFSETNQIQSNSSIIDFGVEKEFAIGETIPFVFPIGEDNRYTPVKVDFIAAGGNSGTTDGSLRLRPRNDVAPIMLSEDQATQDQVLQYHWLINEMGMDGFTADLIANYDDDVVGTDPESSYRGARAVFSDPLLAVENPFPSSGDQVDESSNLITYSISAEDDFSGEYFAGDPVEIPDNFIAWIFDDDSGDGLYSNPANYVEDTNGNGVIDGGETTRPTLIEEVNGGVVRIADMITMTLDDDGVEFSRLTIPSNGTLEVDGTNGHLIGQVSGNGTIRIVTNTPITDAALPAGDYDSFFDCSSGGGTLEYDGTADYTILTGGISQVGALTLRGTGEKTFVEVDITICQDLLLEGGPVIFPEDRTVTVGNDMILTGAAVELAINSMINVGNDLILTTGAIAGSGDAQINLAGDMTRTSASLNMTGVNATTLNLNGSSQQTITGDFSGINAIADVIVDNSASGNAIVISGTLEIDNRLTLTDGIILTEQTDFTGIEPFAIGDMVSFSSTATFSGGSASSYIDGVVCKENLVANTSFRFPTGDDNIFAPITVNEDVTGGSTWKARYINRNPQTDLSADFGNLPVGTEVSSVEYWAVQTSDAQTATISLEYGAQSTVVTPSEITVVAINGGLDGIDAGDQWLDIGRGGLSAGADATGGRIDAEDASSFSANFYTLGGQTATALPVEMLHFSGDEDRGVVYLDWATATEIDNDHFEVQRSQDGRDWEVIGMVEGAGTTIEEQRYGFSDIKPYIGNSYYRLRQVDYDGQYAFTEIIQVTVRLDPISFNVFPNPVVDAFTINVRGVNANEVVPYSIVSLQGGFVSQGELTSDESGRINEQVILGLSQSSGIYILRVHTAEKLFRFNLIKK